MDSIQRILEHLGEPIQPPPVACARGPPHWEEDADQREVAEDAMIEPLPAYELDQRVSWQALSQDKPSCRSTLS